MANTDNMISFVAAEAITEFRLVSVDTDGKIELTDTSNVESCVGIAQRAASAGEAVDVIVSGISRAVAGNAITPGTTSLLMVDANAELVPLVKGSGNFSVARILPNINHNAPADGDQIKVVFTGPSNYAA